jgi:hypothetical protein
VEQREEPKRAAEQQIQPQTTDSSPYTRLNGAERRNSGGNGYQAQARAPASGRPIAAEPRNAPAQTAFATTGAAR